MDDSTHLVLHRKSANRPEVKEAVKTVRREHPELRVLVPWNKKEKPRVVAEALARGATRIIAGGGDGTINAVASALVDRDRERTPHVELGVLPLGTANDFARGQGLPVEDLEECLRIACSRPARPMDVGRAGKRTFLNVASGGYGAQITATTSVELKRRLGGVAYTLMGIVKAFDLLPYTGRLLVPGEPPLEGETLFMAVSNNRFAGGGFEVGPLARSDDGLLDFASVKLPRPLDLAQFARELSDPTAEGNEFVHYRQLSEFVVEADRKLHWNLDGEPVLRRRMRFRVLPGELDVVR